MTLCITTQVNNVLAGKTAFGEETERPMAFTDDASARTALYTWTRSFAFYSAQPDDARRTVFIRKLAHYISRNLPLDMNHMPLFHGTTWFVLHPLLLHSKMSFGRAAELRLQQLAYASGATKRQLRHAAEAATEEAMKMPEPEPLLLLRDCPFTLTELIHPKHVARAGVEGNNCLAYGLTRNRLAHPDYWQQIATGKLHIYAIRHEDALFAVISAAPTAWRQWQITDDRLTTDVAAKCIAAVEARLGPLDDQTLIIHQGQWHAPPRTHEAPQE